MDKTRENHKKKKKNLNLKIKNKINARKSNQKKPCNKTLNENQIYNNAKSYHFIGIGGISMSALAKLLASENHKITGSDINPNINSNLGLEKFPVYVGHSSCNVGKCDIVVFNSAIDKKNLEIISAKQKKIQLQSRAELLGEIAKTYKNVISVSGMHGKTTTTEMIAEVFLQAGLNPTVHLGGISNFFNSNLHIGGKEFFITEACEYKNSFLKLKNTVGVILNIEPEHLDFFKSIDEIEKSFLKFSKTSKITVAPYNFNPKRTIVFKNNEGFFAKNISFSNDKIVFDCYFKNNLFDTITLKALGLHNVDNALACIAVANCFKIEKKHIKLALANFKGVKRRMEIVRTNPFIISDYAHHPTEISSSIKAVRKHLEIQLSHKKSMTKILSNESELKNGSRLVVVFQPHTYSRTNAFMENFIEALCLADVIFIYKTYSARESSIKGASAYDLFLKLRNSHDHDNVKYFNSFVSLSKEIENETKNFSTILILGAGDIEKLTRLLA